MPKEFPIPPVVFPTAPATSNTFHQCRAQSAPATTPIPFMPLSTAASSSTAPPPSNSGLLILRKTLSLLNPFRTNRILNDSPYLTWTFIYFIFFGSVQLVVVSPKFHIGVISGLNAVVSIILYLILNFLLDNKGDFGLYRCISVLGYCIFPIVLFSVGSWLLPASGWVRFVAGGLFVVSAARVCSSLMAEIAIELRDHRWVIGCPCLFIYGLLSLLVLF